MRLAGRTAVVTGASRGIGRAIALALARDGADLVITGRAVPELSSVRDEILALGRQCLMLEADLAAPDAIETLWDGIQRSAASVDILVNNAGIGSSANPKPVIDFDDEFWELTLRVNLTVPYQLCKKALPGMVARGYGRIIFIASINAFRPGVHDAAYTASKSGLVGLMRTLA